MMLLFILISAVSAWFFTMPQNRVIGPPPADFPHVVEQVSFPAKDGLEIRGWYSAPDSARSALVLLHGYRSSRLQTLDRARLFRENGYGVLLYDARGCGESAESRISVGYHEQKDLLGAVEYLKQRGIESIGCLGISQGGATILLASAELQDVACVISESAYSSLTDAVDRRYRHYLKMPGWLGGMLMVPFAESFIGADAADVSPLAEVAHLQKPLLIISGTEDVRTLELDTRNLFAAAEQSLTELWMIDGAGHEDLYDFIPALYEEKVLGFLAKHLVPAGEWE